MTWFPDIADDLPAPRDDEPSSLRQDIADELADHLQSSLVRELHRTPRETSAKQHVLDRFGDPRRVARQLWFDAMKEKIMSQRVLITALVVTAIACLGSTGLTFLLIEQSRQASQALVDQLEQSRKSNEAFLKASREANVAVIEKLVAIATPQRDRETGPAKSMDWNPVKIRLVKDKAGGPPAQGYDVELRGHILDTASANSINRKAGADGIADFGVVRPGEHSLKITTPWNESHHMAVTVLPGQPFSEEVACPAADLQAAPVSFAVDWPDELRDRRLWTVCLAVRGNRQIEGRQWTPERGSNYRLLILTAENDLFMLSSDYRYQSQENPFRFLIRPPGELPGLFYDLEAFNQLLQLLQSGRIRSQSATEHNAGRPFRPYHFQYPNSLKQADEDFPAGRYTLQNILVAEGPSGDPAREWQTIDVLGGMMLDPPGSLAFSEQFQHPFEDWVVARNRTGDPRDDYQRRVKETPTFEVQPGKSNQIKIPIPPKLAENVRRFLEVSR